MGTKLIDGLYLTPLKRIEVSEGDVLRGLKSSDQGFCGFGEAYFSIVKKGFVKAWKMHTKMTLNIIVPIGNIKFVVFDNRENSSTNNVFSEIILGENNYCRLTVPPNLWMGFQGVSESNILLNIASIEHDPSEAEKKDISDIEYQW